MAFLNYTPSHPRIMNELCLVLRIYNTDIDDLLMDQPNQTTFPLQEMENKLNVDNNINLFIGLSEMCLCTVTSSFVPHW